MLLSKLQGVIVKHQKFLKSEEVEEWFCLIGNISLLIFKQKPLFFLKMYLLEGVEALFSCEC